MNATLQCLKSIPELRDAVKRFLPAHLGHGATMIDGTQMVTNALKTTYQQLDVTSDPFMPLTFLATMHREFPRFAEKDDHGHLMQQDANEFWVQLIQILQMNLPGKRVAEETSASEQEKSFIDQYFGISTQSTYVGEEICSASSTRLFRMKCHEAPEETPTVSNERLLQLSCFISQGEYLYSPKRFFTDRRTFRCQISSHRFEKRSYLSLSLSVVNKTSLHCLQRLEEQITKHSSVLGRDAVFNKTVSPRSSLLSLLENRSLDASLASPGVFNHSIRSIFLQREGEDQREDSQSKRKTFQRSR